MVPFDVAMLVTIVLSIILLGFGAVILGMVLTGKIDLSDILVENSENGNRKASLSRLQFLIFSFVIAGLYLVISIESGTFVDVPPGVLVLLGISGGSYIMSKGLGKGMVRPGSIGGQSAPQRPPHAHTLQQPGRQGPVPVTSAQPEPPQAAVGQ